MILLHLATVILLAYLLPVAILRTHGQHILQGQLDMDSV